MIVWLDINLKLRKNVGLSLVVVHYRVCSRVGLYLWKVWMIGSCSCDMYAHQNIKGKGEYWEVPSVGN